MDAQGTQRAPVEPAGGGQAMMALEAGNRAARAVSNRAINRAAVVAELTKADLSPDFRAMAGASVMAATVMIVITAVIVPAILITIIVSAIVILRVRGHGGGDEKGSCQQGGNRFHDIEWDEVILEFIRGSSTSQNFPCDHAIPCYARCMLHRIVIPAFALAAPAFAADLAAIPFKTLEGKETSLKDYSGKVVLMVNTASKCGLTPQYEKLQALYDRHKERGLVVVGFPSNDFAGQEPGSASEIEAFCKTKYAVTFPLMEKIHVKGPEQHPLYAALTGPQGAFPGEVKWNFGKFLIGRDGKPLARFEPKTPPDSPEVIQAVEKALDAK